MSLYVHRLVHFMCKQIYNAYGYNGICVTALDLHILLEAREALPSRDFCGHKLTALGNNQLGCFKRQGKGAFHVKFASYLLFQEILQSPAKRNLSTDWVDGTLNSFCPCPVLPIWSSLLWLFKIMILLPYLNFIFSACDPGISCTKSHQKLKTIPDDYFMCCCV